MKCYHMRLTARHEGDTEKIGICCKHHCHHYPGGLQSQRTVMNNMKTVSFPPPMRPFGKSIFWF